MKRYMLDTNVVSDFLRGNGAVEIKLMTLPADRVFVSAIVAAELLHGVAKRPLATRLNGVIEGFLSKVEILSWDADVARGWGSFRASLEKSGRMLEPHDMQIAAHAISLDMVLVSNNRAFEGIDGLELENWAV
jgi:tRNA(fMet)-specific endonuclease VapC